MPLKFAATVANFVMSVLIMPQMIFLAGNDLWLIGAIFVLEWGLVFVLAATYPCNPR